MPFRLVLGLSLLCLACGEDPPRGMAVQSIVNGTPDDGDPAVVALTYRGYAFCTGTVIAPRYVVTAAHCLADVPVPMTTCEVFFGSDLAKPGESIAIAEAIPHPAFDHASPTFEVNDIAVLRLASPTQVPPVQLARAALGPGSIGQEMRIVGFGRTSPDGSTSGVKRQGTAHVLELGGTFFSMSVSPLGHRQGRLGRPRLHPRGRGRGPRRHPRPRQLHAGVRRGARRPPHRPLPGPVRRPGGCGGAA